MSESLEVARAANRLASGDDPWAPDGPQNETEWDLCAAAWRMVARRLIDERQAVLNCINLFGDEVLHDALDAAGLLPCEGGVTGFCAL